MEKVGANVPARPRDSRLNNYTICNGFTRGEFKAVGSGQEAVGSRGPFSPYQCRVLNYDGLDRPFLDFCGDAMCKKSAFSIFPLTLPARCGEYSAVETHGIQATWG
jgi:hypothetical protein